MRRFIIDTAEMERPGTSLIKILFYLGPSIKMYQANGEYGVYTLSIFMYVPIYQPNCLSRNLFAYLSSYLSID